MKDALTLGEIVTRFVEKAQKRRDPRQRKIILINKNIMISLLEERMKALALEYEVEYTERGAAHLEVYRWSSSPDNSDGFELEIKLKEGQCRTFQFQYEDMECFLDFINNLPQTIKPQ